MTDAEHSAAMGDQPQFPSFEERIEVRDWTVLSPEAYRIRWALSGPLTEAVSIMPKSGVQEDDAVFEPYCLAPDGAEPTWHPFSQSPLTEPKISSIRIHVDPLDEWGYYWIEKHREHVGPGRVYGPTRFHSPHLSDAQNDEMENEVLLMACCGTRSPRDKGTDVVVQATGDFVTIHDYLSVVHPYLMGRREDILAALNEGVLREDCSLPDDTKLMVSWATAKGLDVIDEEEWESSHRKRTPVPPLPNTWAAQFVAQRQQQLQQQQQQQQNIPLVTKSIAGTNDSFHRIE